MNDRNYIAPDRLEHFAWKPGDVELEIPRWTLSYRRGGSEILVQSLDELVQHILQAYPDDDPEIKIGQIAEQYGDDMPPELRVELLDHDLLP
jgi:hypothetical protein